MAMTPREEAIALVTEAAEFYADNLEETLGLRMNDEMLTNDELWKSVLDGLANEDDREQANMLRDLYRAFKVLQENNDESSK